MFQVFSRFIMSTVTTSLSRSRIIFGLSNEGPPCRDPVDLRLFLRTQAGLATDRLELSIYFAVVVSCKEDTLKVPIKYTGKCLLRLSINITPRGDSMCTLTLSQTMLLLLGLPVFQTSRTIRINSISHVCLIKK